MTLELRIMATGTMTSKQLMTLERLPTPVQHPGDHETVTKATARPRHTGRLLNYHCPNSADMADTVAPRRPMPRHG
jgi:hypothetical protein